MAPNLKMRALTFLPGGVFGGIHTVLPVSGDATTTLQAALDEFGVIALTAGQTYEIRQTIFISSNGGILGNGATIHCPAVYFNNTNGGTGTRYGTNSVAIAMFGSSTDAALPLENVILRDLRVIGDYVDGTNTRIVCARNVDGGIIDNVEVSGFAIGIAITLQTLRNFKVTHCTPNTYTTNLDWGSAAAAQATGIEVDNDKIQATDSTSLIIDSNTIYDFTQGAVAIAAWGNQTDGINLIGGDGVIVTNNRTRNCGEGIDCTNPHHCTVSNNVTEDSYLFGLKVMHAAHANVFGGNVMRRSGLAGLVLAGGSYTGDTHSNVFFGGIIDEIDPDGIWAAGSDTSCILLGTDSAGHQVINNTIEGIACNPGANGEYVIKFSLQATSVNRIRIRPVAKGTAGWVSASGAIPVGTVLAVDNPTNVQVSLSGVQNIASPSDVLVVFNTETIDARGEFDTATGFWTCQIPGRYNVKVQLRASVVVAAETTVRIKLSGTNAAATVVTPNNTATRSFPLLDFDLLVTEGQTIGAYCSVASGNFDLSAGVSICSMTIRPVSN